MLNAVVTGSKDYQFRGMQHSKNAGKIERSKKWGKPKIGHSVFMKPMTRKQTKNFSMLARIRYQKEIAKWCQPFLFHATCRLPWIHHSFLLSQNKDILIHGRLLFLVLQSRMSLEIGHLQFCMDVITASTLYPTMKLLQILLGMSSFGWNNLKCMHYPACSLVNKHVELTYDAEGLHGHHPSH